MATFCLPLHSQSDFENSLARFKGNKIILLGAQNAADSGKWKQIIEADGIFEHGFTLLNRESLASGGYFELKANNMDAFERFVRQRFGLSTSARWLAVDAGNNLIATGAQVPDAKEFDQMLDQRGLKTPARKLRDFLRENPDHIDAMTDLLKEVRRRALRVMPASQKEDLDAKADLLAWAVMATETDKVFNGQWLGIDINFFRADQEQPERHSKLMRAVFSRHLPKVEAAVRENPLDDTLWNIWAWMARCSPDYNWARFANSIEPLRFPLANIYGAFPSPEVCAWLVEGFRQKGDWESVIKFAKNARYHNQVVTGSSRYEWTPGGSTAFSSGREDIKDYPAKSAYAPWLEGLLRLGRLDEANDLYDEMIRYEGKEDRFNKSIVVDGESHAYRSNNALIAANAARAAGMEDLAKTWEQGALISKAPHVISRNPFMTNGFAQFYVRSDSSESGYSKKFSELANSLSSVLRVYGAPAANANTLGWSAGDGDRWALVGGDLKVIEQGQGLPEQDALQFLLSRNNIKDEAESIRSYMSEYGAQPGLELELAFFMIDRIHDRLGSQQGKPASAQMNVNADDPFIESSRYLNRVLTNSPGAMINMPYVYRRLNDPPESQSMKAISRPMLAHLEPLLLKKPSSSMLWGQWLYWRWMEGAQRPIEPLMEAVVPSPISSPGSVPPGVVFDAFYDECKREGRWDKVVKLLKAVWDREFGRITDLQRENPNFKPSISIGDRLSFEASIVARIGQTLGDRVVVPLMEAYLRDGKSRDANDIFNAWLGCGGTISDISKVVELAKELRYEGIAREWEERVKK
jgi:pentatricopeptide repeat protein